MDIAKYIGLFLLKNRNAYVPGLGNLELRRKAASFDGEALQGPEYSVVLSTRGSLDDSLANFIAEHEQTSIAKASNNLRDFASFTKQETAEGKDVQIPGLGHFYQQGGKLEFAADPNFSYSPEPLPVTRITRREDPETTFSSEASHTGSQVQWGKIILLSVLAIVLGIGGYFAVSNILKSHRQNNPPAVDQAPAYTVEPAPQAVPDSVTPPPPASSGNSAIPQVVLAVYPTEAEASQRAQKLQKIGKEASMVAEDSNRFLVVMPFSGEVADSTRIVDSLGRLYSMPRTGRAYLRYR